MPMKALTVLMIFAVVFVLEKPANAQLECSIIARGSYSCIEGVEGILWAYHWTATKAEVTPVEGYPNRATALCDNIYEEDTMQFGRRVQNVEMARVSVHFWLTDVEIGPTHTDDILCEGESPIMYAWVRGGTLFWHDYDRWWDYWCTVSAWNAGNCYHPNVYESFYSWYLIYY
jgi:hypothetical protein